MAEVLPFQGVLFNSEVIGDMADVVTPPYDVISAQEQEGFYQRHPNNVVRLILGKSKPGDKSTGDIHHRAARYFEQWLSSRVLVQDDGPAFYLTSVTFSVGSSDVTRYGIIGRVRLEPFDKGIVLPHERTFSKVKSERLQLMQACHANFSPIFGLYADGDGSLQQLIEKAAAQAPDMDFVDSKGLIHKLWRLFDPELQGCITSALKDQCIYIADGHHRYETALNYRKWVADHNPNFDQDHPANYVMMNLSSLSDPGMVIFPAHRLLQDVSIDDKFRLFDELGTYFDSRIFPTAAGPGEVMDAFDTALAQAADHHAIGMYCKDPEDRCELSILILKEGVMERLFGEEIPGALLDLDVTVLTRLVMMELLGYDQDRLDDATKIGYATTSKAAVEAVERNQADIAFILNPTRIEQVQRVSRAGLIMPRKSTYFYPKVGSGMVFNLLR